MIIILLVTIAPILQIIASILRIMGRIVLPIVVIMVMAFILGIACAFWAMTTIPVPPQTNQMPRCGMPEAAVLMCRVLLQFITTPLIAIVSYIAYIMKVKRHSKILSNLVDA